MPMVAVIYATREGHTGKIAGCLVESLRARGLEAEAISVRSIEEPFDLARFDAAVLAASVHGGRHEHEMVEFVRRHRQELVGIRNAFVSVSLTEVIAEDEQASPEARAHAAGAVQRSIDTFYDATGWKPEQVRAVAGALPYRRYSALVRFLVKRIVKSWGGPTDTTKDYEFTNWVAVRSLADDLAGHLAPR